jgi:hypothetical protein
VVSLVADAVSEADPTAAANYDATAKTATADYVIEIANNGPVPVTVRNASTTVAQAITTTGWHPVGTATIPAGGTGRIEMGLKLDCVWESLPIARYLTPFTGHIVFPPTTLTVTTPNGASHDAVLDFEGPSDRTRPLANGLRETPSVSMVRQGPCFTPATAGGAASGGPGDPAAPFQQPFDNTSHGGLLNVAYDGVTSSATTAHKQFAMTFTATNPSKTDTVTVATQYALQDIGAFQSAVEPPDFTLAPGASQKFTVTAETTDCPNHLQPVSMGSKMLAMTIGSGTPEVAPLAQLLVAPSLRMDLDEAAQAKAACP